MALDGPDVPAFFALASHLQVRGGVSQSGTKHGLAWACVRRNCGFRCATEWAHAVLAVPRPHSMTSPVSLNYKLIGKCKKSGARDGHCPACGNGGREVATFRMSSRVITKRCSATPTTLRVC